MKTIGNLIWLVLSGIWMALGWLITAGLLALTIVGLPFARQCLKFSRFRLWQFGRTVVKSPDASRLGTLGNILWLLPGLLLALGYVLTGLLMAITIIGIPFAFQ